MTKQINAILLAALLGSGSLAHGAPSKHATPSEQAHAIPANSPVEVKLVEGATRRGWINEVSDTGFVLSREQKHQMTKSPIAFTQVKSLKQVATATPSHVTRNVLIGVGVVAAGFFAFLVFVGANT